MAMCTISLSIFLSILEALGFFWSTGERIFRRSFGATIPGLTRSTSSRTTKSALLSRGHAQNARLPLSVSSRQVFTRARDVSSSECCSEEILTLRMWAVEPRETAFLGFCFPLGGGAPFYLFSARSRFCGSAGRYGKTSSELFLLCRLACFRWRDAPLDLSPEAIVSKSTRRPGCRAFSFPKHDVFD